jgi:uncharacterized protein
MSNNFVDTAQDLPASSPGDTNSISQRLFSLDVLRGIALLGILVISIWEFGGFSTNEQNRLRLLGKGVDFNLFASTLLLFEGKMRALFSLVFGAGIVLYMQKPNQPGLPSTQELYIRRQMWLMGFGVINAFLFLWPGDILFQYGVMGILLFPFFRMGKKGLLIAAIIVTLIYCGKMYWFYDDDHKSYKKFKAITLVEEKNKKDSAAQHIKDSLSGMSKADLKKSDSLFKERTKLNAIQQRDKSRWEGLVKGLKYDSTKGGEKAEKKAMQGSYATVWKYLYQRSQGKEAAWLYRIGIWDIGSMMFLGMALLGFGFFSNRMSNTTYVLLAVVGIAAGVLLALLRMDLQHTKMLDYVKYLNKKAIPPNQFFPIERLCMALGYASLVMLLIRSKLLQWLWYALAATGRLAFTNYFMQTLLCTFFFYGYGFGYFGRLSQMELYFFVAEIWLVQIVFSVFWVRYYQYGPVEWLWRCLVHRKRFPNKKEPVA